jgi:hypothetical protein
MGPSRRTGSCAEDRHTADGKSGCILRAKPVLNVGSRHGYVSCSSAFKVSCEHWSVDDGAYQSLVDRGNIGNALTDNFLAVCTSKGEIVLDLTRLSGPQIDNQRTPGHPDLA